MKTTYRNIIYSTLTLVIICFFAGGGYFVYKLMQYKTLHWFPGYISSLLFSERYSSYSGKNQKHLMFIFVDHHEPGTGKNGVITSKKWNIKYQQNINDIFDDYGNKFQYSWFYAYDHLNAQVVLGLNELVFADLGEIEFHWHHENHTNDSFIPELETAIQWFKQLGCLYPVGHNPKAQFAFIHGNWALDNSSLPEFCGVSQEISIFKKAGGYADFTFSTISTDAQPKKINSIYYTIDTPEPKSHDNGIDVSVGTTNDDFIIFQGPLAFDVHDRIFEYGAIEHSTPFKKHRIPLWHKHAAYVKGKPEWRFIKLFTHGVQHKHIIIEKPFRDMLFELKKYCQTENIALHFVTSREAYNIVKAAEAGENGNPEEYRDFVLAKPINRVVRITSPLKDSRISNDQIFLDYLIPNKSLIEFKIGPILSIDGTVSTVVLKKVNNKYVAEIIGSGEIIVFSRTEISFENKVSDFQPKGNHFQYKLAANTGIKKI